MSVSFQPILSYFFNHFDLFDRPPSHCSISEHCENPSVILTFPTPNLGSQKPIAEPEPEEDGAKKGKLSSLIYGTKEGRELDREIEHSFSQVLARGKYVHSIVFHQVKPDKVDEYVKLVGDWYPRMAGMPENKVHLVGSWRTEVGDCDTFGLFSPYLPSDIIQ